ncbi:MAG: hypothetical protein H7Y05_10170 [Steroidobacteraceae bacterium]|nr:hypothetical protein [Deltaproteobacteria bacterium]
MSFHKQLVLNRWMYGFFCGRSLHAFKARLGDDRHEGIEDDGQTRFFHELSRNLVATLLLVRGLFLWYF